MLLPTADHEQALQTQPDSAISARRMEGDHESPCVSECIPARTLPFLDSTAVSCRSQESKHHNMVGLYIF